MGNCGLGAHIRFSKQVVKLVHKSGLVEEFYGPIKAAELLVDYPDHFICDAASLVQLLNGESCNDFRVDVYLSEGDDMGIGEVYFLLPKRMLYERQSQNDVARLISKASIAMKESYSFVPLPVLPAKDGGYGHIDHDEERNNEEVEEERHRAFVRRVIAEAKVEMERCTAADPLLGSQLSSDPQLKSAFARHMLARSCSRLWRPPLDTVDEDATNCLTV
ncbi:hypothetical protein KP509_26G065000 [Ceratopteris richardii]|uniref:Uncharacterized protein n=1 Tax=Ceratopteris richardii TaxID=49495 RepID=A0A8T2RPE1_CERRI|nr:hypothetical protein KP509_26G065000 [Ceratopteris richardii]